MSNQRKTARANPAQTIKRAPKDAKRISAHQTRMKLLSSCSGMLFGLGTYFLIDPQSIGQWVEVATIGLAGGVANYAINTVAITRGAYQAASGVTGAAAASVGAIVATGATISLVSFTGLTINGVDQMILKDFGDAHSVYMEEQIAAARQGDEVIVAVDTAHMQIEAAAECERTNSCVSRVGNGGEGLTYHTLNGVAGQIASVQETLSDGEALRDEALGTIEEAEADKLAALDGNFASRKSRRAAVQEAIARQDKALGALERALPLAVVRSLANSLHVGVDLPGQRTASERINGRLSPAGNGIAAALENIGESETDRPPMPRETGVNETLNWIGFFLPLFLMLIIIDLLLASLLWFFTFSALRPHVEPEDDPDDDPFAPDTVLDAPPVLLDGGAAGIAKPRSRRTANHDEG